MTDLTPSATEQRCARPDEWRRPSNAPILRKFRGLPAAQGLYDPRNEHDACGVGFIAQMKGVKSHQIVEDGLSMLENLTHRGAVGADPLMGDGAGVLVQIPDRFFREEMARQGIDLPPVGHYGVGHWFMPQDAAAARRISTRSSPSRRSPKACRSSASATCRSTIPRCPRRPTSPRPSRSTARSSSAAAPRSRTTRNTRRGSISCAR